MGAGPSVPTSLSHTITFDEFPVGTTIADPTLYHLEGAAIGSGVVNCEQTYHCAYTATSTSYPGSGPFLTAPIDNSNPDYYPNSEYLASDFINPSIDPLTSNVLGASGVHNVSFDLVPYGWPYINGPIKVQWLNLQFLTSRGTQGRFVETSYYPTDGSVIHVTQPAGEDWIAAGAYIDNLAQPMFGLDNLSWSGYAHPTAGEQGRTFNASSFSTTCKSGDPVDCATGAFNEDVTDVAIPGRGIGLSLSRSYNSQAAQVDGRFGYGWTDSYAMSLALDSGTGSATVTQENGAEATFQPDGSSAYVPDPGIRAALSENPDGSYIFARRSDRETFTFDSAGHLTSETDRNGYVTTLAYTGSNLSSVTDPAGRTLTFSYSGGHVASVTDPLGATVYYTYDAAGNLETVTDRAGRLTRYGYDSNHLLLTITNPRQGVTTNVYDAGGRVTSQTDPANLTTTWSYTGDNSSATGGQTILTDPHGNETVYVYANLELLSVTHAYGTDRAATTSYAYDAVTLARVSVADPDGRTTTSAYDSDGNLTASTDGAGQMTTYTYDASGDRLTQSAPGGGETDWTYDASGNTLTTTDVAAAATTTYHYDDPAHPGDLTSATDPDGRVTRYAYDSFGDKTATTVTPTPGTSYTSTAVFDANGNQVCSVSPAQHASGISCPPAGDPRVAGTTTTVYNADGQPTAVTNPQGHTVGTAYDGNGNVVSQTDADGNVTHTNYDGDNRPTSVTTGYGGAAPATSNTSYDITPGTAPCTGAITGATYCTSTSDPDGDQTVSYYNADDQRVAQVRPGGQIIRYVYDLAGQQTMLTDAAGRVTTTSYDLDGRPSSITYSDGATPGATYTYTPDGQRATMIDGSGTTTYSYYADDRLESVTNGSGATVSYQYDGAGHVTQLTYPNGHTITNIYDGAGQLQSQTDWAGHTTSYQYNPDGAFDGATLGNGDTIGNSLNADDALTRTTLTNGATTLAAINYTRDNADLNNQQDDSGVISGSTPYGYNDKNQLTSAATASYGYDPAGQPTSYRGATQTFNSMGELTGVTGGGAATSIGYDTVGDRITSQSNTAAAPTVFDYDQAGHLLDASTGYRYHPINAVRVADTRPGSGQPYAGQTLAAGATLNIATTGQGGIPQTGVSAVLLNITEVSTTGSGYVTAFPTGSTRPTTANLSLVSGQAISGEATIKPGTNGQIAIYNSAGSTNIVVDVLGYFGTTGDTLVPLTATRIADTSTGSGYQGAGSHLVAGGTLNVQVTGNGGVPANAVAVVIDVSASNTKSTGSLTVYAAGTARPATTNLNYIARTPQTEQVVVPVSTTTFPLGAITVYNGGSATSDIAVDVVGYYISSATGQPYTPITNARVADTVTGSGYPYAGQHIGSGGAVTIQVAGANGIPAGSTAVLVSLTSLNTSSAGSLTAYPAGAAQPTAVITLATLKNQNASGEALIALNSAGALTIHNSAGTTDVILDVEGYTTAPLANYSYNGDGLRTTATAQTGTVTRFSYDSSGQAPKLLSDGSTNYIYGPNGTAVEQINDAGTAVDYYLSDAIGSTRVLTDQSGAVAATYTYDPYGNLASRTGAATTPIQFAGAYHDSVTGYYYLLHRYYDPATGQFTSVDPALDTTGQPYNYAGDNPVNQIDPNGLDWYNPFSWSAKSWATFGVVLGAVALASTGVGLLADSAALTYTGVALGTAATFIDEKGCKAGDQKACAGFALGLLASLVGGGSLAIERLGLAEAGQHATSETIVAASNWSSLQSVLDSLGLGIAGAQETIDIAGLLSETC